MNYAQLTQLIFELDDQEMKVALSAHLSFLNYFVLFEC